jgi:hypothetical protein
MPSFRVPRALRVAVLFVFALVVQASATDLVVFDGAGAGPAPSTATVRRLPSAEIWIFADPAVADAVGGGIHITVSGSARLEHLHRRHAGVPAPAAEVLWENEEFRIVDVAPGTILPGSEPLDPAVGSVARSTLEPGKLHTSLADETALVAAVDQARYSQIIAHLAGAASFDLGGSTRQVQSRDAKSTGDDEIALAEDYIADRFEAAGYPVTRQEFSFSTSDTAANIIAVKEGTLYPDEILVVGAHYDATNKEDSFAGPALGAEDNASGTAAVIHLAEILSGWQTERTIHFIAFGAEEYGLLGSTYYVEQANLDGLDVVGALTMDMVSHWATDFGVLIEGTIDPDVTALMDVVQANLQQWTALTYARSTFSWGSDHVPFQTAGIPATLTIELDEDEYDPYHTGYDTFDKVRPEMGAEVVRVMAGCVADLAGLSPNVRVEPPASGNPPRAARLGIESVQPNPFNPRTTIAFSIPKLGPTRLWIADARGRRVGTLIEETLAAGPHEKIWDGTDARGVPVASGTYYVRLEHPAGHRSMPLTLVR